MMGGCSLEKMLKPREMSVRFEELENVRDSKQSVTFVDLKSGLIPETLHQRLQITLTECRGQDF